MLEPCAPEWCTSNNYRIITTNFVKNPRGNSSRIAEIGHLRACVFTSFVFNCLTFHELLISWLLSSLACCMAFGQKKRVKRKVKVLHSVTLHGRNVQVKCWPKCENIARSWRARTEVPNCRGCCHDGKERDSWTSWSLSRCFSTVCWRQWYNQEMRWMLIL